MTHGSINTSSVTSQQIRMIAPRVVMFVLLLIVAWLLARLTWEIIEAWKAPEMTETIALDGTTAQQKSGLYDWQTLPLFGVVRLENMESSEPARPRPATGVLARMQLDVLGIVDSDTPANSYIVIREKGETMVLQEDMLSPCP